MGDTNSMRFWFLHLLHFLCLLLHSASAAPAQQVLAMPQIPAPGSTLDSRPFAIIIGGSYTGWRTVECLVAAKHLHEHFRVLMIEQHSHFEHIFAFPRFGVTNGLEVRKAFVPFRPGPFFDAPESFDGQMLQARVLNVSRDSVVLDRAVLLDGETVAEIPYKYLFVATGTRLTPPSMIPSNEKADSINYLARHASRVKQSKRIVLIGAGAVGVQSSMDIRELYPDKEVTLIHSRHQTMNHFDPRLHDIVMHRAKELNVKVILGARAKIPTGGFPEDGRPFHVELEGGRTVETDMVIVCIGQTPQSDLIRSLSPQSITPQGYVKVKKTLQIDDEEFPNVFVYGDVGQTGAHKSGRSGWLQAQVAVDNLGHLIAGTKMEQYVHEPPGIYLSLGIKHAVLFSNAPEPGGECSIQLMDIGAIDHKIEDVWQYRHGGDDYDA